MKNVRLFRGGFAIFIALLGATPLVSLAQVWSTGPNGQMGYYTTPNPISPDCKAPLVWTLTNGHYTCQRPQQPVCQSGYNTVSAATWTGSGWTQPECAQPPLQPVPPPPDPLTACESSVPSGFSLESFMNSGGFDPRYPSDTIYSFTGYGPTYESGCYGAETGYFLYCSASPRGNVDEWSEQPYVGNGNCNH